MKKIILFLMFMLLVSNCYSAEFLVLAVDGSHYTHFKENEVVLIRPNNEDWDDKCVSCAKPIWKIIKAPEVTEKQAEYLLEAVTADDENRTLLKQRKYKLTIDDTTTTNTKNNVYVVDTIKTSSFMTKIIDKEATVEIIK